MTRHRNGNATVLLLAVLASAATLFALHVQHLHRARMQREAVTRLQALGGIVVYEYMVDECGRYVLTDNPFLSTWICGLLGKDYFYGVESAVLVSGKASDEDVKHIKNLSGLSSLALCCHSISDNNVKQLGDISTLEFVFLAGDNLTPESVTFLRKRLPRCEIHLSISPKTKNR